MKDGLGNETMFSYPEIVPGATREWGGMGDIEGNIVVTKKGLRDLLQLAADAWPLAMAHLVAKNPDDKNGHAITHEALASMLNRCSAIWCEGDLIVSGLFVDASGNPLESNIRDTVLLPVANPAGT